MRHLPNARHLEAVPCDDFSDQVSTVASRPEGRK